MYDVVDIQGAVVTLMTILGHGVDVVFVPRIAALLKRFPQRLPAKILSPEETTDEHRPEDPQFIAVRWAVKEAAYKAVYPYHRPTWKDFSYRSLRENRKPELRFHPSSSRVGNIHVSVSHDGDYVFASVIVEVSTE
ncbi:4'-phosphopantetheinyl transferase [Mycena chlorophos]|uniref:4'-phosphopantetheinyl transferase n=1 Tax=Mycena chlorophos TaxID=658473 RepID=A0A8H6TBF0_MYCCL|nr:4'-phosphopantetheinyl transferase [Mycena chlorophos]